MRSPEQLIVTTCTRLAVLACLGVVAACGTHRVAPDASAMPRETVTDTTVLLTGMLIEGSWQAGPDDSIVIELDTSVAGLDWDVHAHANNSTQDVASGFSQMTVNYVFHPPQEAQWYLLLRNSSDEVLRIDVRMDLYGQAQWNGWQ